MRRDLWEETVEVNVVEFEEIDLGSLHLVKADLSIKDAWDWLNFGALYLATASCYLLSGLRLALLHLLLQSSLAPSAVYHRCHSCASRS